jgi:hypothetical protein
LRSYYRCLLLELNIVVCKSFSNIHRNLHIATDQNTHESHRSRAADADDFDVHPRRWNNPKSLTAMKVFLLREPGAGWYKVLWNSVIFLTPIGLLATWGHFCVSGSTAVTTLIWLVDKPPKNVMKEFTVATS